MSSIVWVFMTSSAPLSWVASKQHPSDGWNQKIPTPTTNVWEDCIYHTTAFYFECSPLFYPKQHTSSSRCYRWNFASHASTGFSQHTLHTRACKPTYTQPKPVFRYTKASSSFNFIMFVKCVFEEDWTTESHLKISAYCSNAVRNKDYWNILYCLCTSFNSNISVLHTAILVLDFIFLSGIYLIIHYYVIFFLYFWFLPWIQPIVWALWITKAQNHPILPENLLRVWTLHAVTKTDPCRQSCSSPVLCVHSCHTIRKQ